MKLDSAVFYSNDINKVVEFYTTLLNIKVEYQRGDKYVSFLFDNGVRLGIKKAVEEREIPGAQTIFIQVENIEEYFNEVKNKNVTILKPLTNEGFDIGSNFSILDPDKNKIQFISRELEN
jgi:predicted enzyme related to lactoylglutathione lyase